VAAILVGYGIFLLLFFNQKSELETTRQQLASLTPIVNRVQEIKKERKELEAALQEYTILLQKQIIWSDLFFALNNVTPDDLWLTELETAFSQEEQKSGPEGGKPEVLARPDIMNFKGLSCSVPSIGLFMNNLSQLPYFKEVKLVKLNKENEGISFQITTLLKE
jgi:type IV pilus assembly protein PilN